MVGVVVVVGRGERVVIKRCGLRFSCVTSPGRRRTSTGRRRSREDGRFNRGGREFPRRRGRRRSSLNDDLICGRLGGLGDRHRHLLLLLGGGTRLGGGRFHEGSERVGLGRVESAGGALEPE